MIEQFLHCRMMKKINQIKDYNSINSKQIVGKFLKRTKDFLIRNIYNIYIDNLSSFSKVAFCLLLEICFSSQVKKTERLAVVPYP